MAKKRGSEEAEPEQEGPGKTNYNVSPEKFIEVWEQAASAEEVSDTLGMPRPIVHARASLYRGLGVKLKSMPRSGSNRALDVAGLNKLIESIHAKQSKTPKG